MVCVNAFGTVNEVLRHFIHPNRKTLGKIRCTAADVPNVLYRQMLYYGRLILFLLWNALLRKVYP